MRFFCSSRWLIGLSFMVLLGCGTKDESGGATRPVASSPTSSATMTLPATTGATVSRMPQSQRSLALLPVAPKANDPLFAVFQSDSGTVLYRWEKDGELLVGENRDRLSANYLAKGAVITVIVDNNGEEYSASVAIGNLPPELRQVSFRNPAIHRGVDIELDVIGFDADGDDISFHYQWFRNGTKIDFIDGFSLPGDQFSRGDQISFLVIPYDGEDEGVAYEGTAISIPNAPPYFLSTAPVQFLSDTYSYQAQAIDPDGDELTYLLENPPAGMSIDGKTGQISWDLRDVSAGTYSVRIVAEDPQGQKAYQEYTLTMSRQ